MTAVDEQTRDGRPRCSVLIPVKLWSAPALVRCPFPAEGHLRGVCACGHPREGDLCGDHAAMAGEGGCRACLELKTGAHDCPLTVDLITGGASL
jgi:hypothetical protein